MKTCTKCGTAKDLATGFYRNKRSRDGYLTVCRACVCAERREYVNINRAEVYAKSRAYQEANKERIQAMNRAYHKKHNARLRALKRELETGFSPELFDKTIIAQAGKCGICGVDLQNIRPQHVHADHCHATKQPRGVLCQVCNTALGRLGDSAESIRKVLFYLENPPAQKILRGV